MAKQLSAMANPEKMNLNNSGTVELSKMRRIEDITINEDFSSLFPIREDMLNEISERMRESGYDKSWPVHIWKEEDILVDGHTRRLAALNAGLIEIPTFEHSFVSLEEAIEYAISCQTSRRNLNDAELFSALSKLDQLKSPGKKAEDSQEEKGKSSEKLAAKLNTSPRKIEKARAVQKQGTDEIKEAVSAGKISLNKAYQEIKKSDQVEDKELDELESDDEKKDFDTEEMIDTTQDDIEDESFLEDILSDIEDEETSEIFDPSFGIKESYNDSDGKVDFMVTIVGILIEANERNAAIILINEILSKAGKEALYDLLPQDILNSIKGTATI
jgi:ParB family chromosome partitioning protein